MSEKFFPTERETWRATRMINKIADDFPKVKEELIVAFAESDSMEEFRDRAATYLWYSIRNQMACAKKMGLDEDLKLVILETLDEQHTSQQEYDSFGSFLEVLMNRAEWQVF